MKIRALTHWHDLQLQMKNRNFDRIARLFFKPPARCPVLTGQLASRITVYTPINNSAWVRKFTRYLRKSPEEIEIFRE